MRKSLRINLVPFLLIGVFSMTLAAQEQTLQKVYIESFTQDPFDQAAKTYRKTDNNGDLYALIKVRPASDKFAFSFGLLKSIVDTEYHKDETWLYVQKNARKVSIQRDGFAPVMNADLGITLDAGATYILNLTYTEPAIAVQKQWLQFAVAPASSKASVSVRQEGQEQYDIWGQVDAHGFIARNISCGTYEYKIKADGYSETSGNVVLNNPKGTYKEVIVLVSNKGILQVEDAFGISGAEVYVDGEWVGTAPGKWERPSGKYALTIVKGETFKTYKDTFEIRGGETTVVTPYLISNECHVRLIAGKRAQIYVDKELKGTNEWTGTLTEGMYEVECRQENHESTIKTIEVHAGEPLVVYLDAPKPKTGDINVTTNPLGAAIILDGRQVGISPMTLQDIMIGEHELKFSMDGYKSDRQTINVELKQTLEVEVQLTAKSQNSENKQDTIAVREKVKPVPATEKVEKEQKTATVKTSFGNYNVYIQPSFQICSPMSAGVAIGGYLANINLEAYFQAGLSKSPEISWLSEQGGTTYTEQYGSTALGGRAGYRFSFGRFQVTPQAGIGVFQLKSVSKETAGYTLTASIGCRAECIIVKHLSVVLAPYYGFDISQSDTYKKLENASSTLKIWGAGFDLQVGLSLYF